MLYKHNNILWQINEDTKCIITQKEVYAKDKVWEDIMQTEELLKNILFYTPHTLFMFFMQSMPGPNGI